jgi:hypothetical protein
LYGTHNLWYTDRFLPWAGFKLIGLVVVGTACTCSRKPSYQSITTTMANWSQLTDIWHEMLTKQGGMAKDVLDTTFYDTFVSVNCDRTIVFSEYSGFSKQYNWSTGYNRNTIETTTMANWSQLTDIWHEMLTKQGGMARVKEYMS